ncbi:tripartite tricarboxylate transporter permease [Halorussus caseinilyticus]|uniref:tripartite tricarboxylate transporter permease n=1 Tax=Halorussus caseinilyticus TaxID=3034025 RepID=UPI0023E7A8CA|nr:tripartite tricarboxylate transporter permease [Halorussus sp. DT72]
MEALGVRLGMNFGFSATALAFVLGGVALGTLSGLTPGLHVNNLALLLASAAPAVPGPPRLVGAAMLAAGVVHSFLDAVPALALGVPDAAMAATALPGHRLVVAGRGREAVRLSALGSGLAVAFAVPLAVPVTRGMTVAYPVVRAHLPVVLGVVVAFLLLTEGSVRAALGGAAAFAGSATLGHATLDLTPAAPLDAGGMLTPLFAGLFGAPVLLEALSGGGVPAQDDPVIAAPRRTVAVTALAGSVAGAVVGYLPGVSSAVAAVLALAVVPGSTDARGFVVATSGVNTANTIFALFALAALGTPRTGVMVALQEADAPVNLPLLLATAGIAGIAGFLLVLVVGDRYLRTVGTVDQFRLSTGVLVLLAGLSFLFAGVLGVAVFAVATLVGLVPAQFGARRVHLMGVLLGPLILGL